jgi:hypothetical protein
MVFALVGLAQACLKFAVLDAAGVLAPVAAWPAADVARPADAVIAAAPLAGMPVVAAPVVEPLAVEPLAVAALAVEGLADAVVAVAALAVAVAVVALSAPRAITEARIAAPRRRRAPGLDPRRVLVVRNFIPLLPFRARAGATRNGPEPRSSRGSRRIPWAMRWQRHGCGVRIKKTLGPVNVNRST